MFVSRITQKLLIRFFAKFGGKLAHGPRMKLLDFAAILDHVTLGLGLSWLRRHRAWELGNFATSAALVDMTDLTDLSSQSHDFSTFIIFQLPF